MQRDSERRKTRQEVGMEALGKPKKSELRQQQWGLGMGEDASCWTELGSLDHHDLLGIENVLFVILSFH